MLGEESLRRFVAREPLARVHEAVFGVFALDTSSQQRDRPVAEQEL
jgi:PNKP adenylyltransferase domain, C-terminal region